MTTSHSIFKEVNSRVLMSDIIKRFLPGQEIHKGFISCPFHNEDTPSLRVYPHSFYCFGCGAGGDVISFIAKLHNLNNQEACKEICKNFGIGTSISKLSEHQYKREKRNREYLQEKINQANIVLCKYYRSIYYATPESGPWIEKVENLEQVEYYLGCLRDDPDGFVKNNWAVIEKYAKRLH